MEFHVRMIMASQVLQLTCFGAFGVGWGTRPDDGMHHIICKLVSPQKLGEWLEILVFRLAKLRPPSTSNGQMLKFKFKYSNAQIQIQMVKCLNSNTQMLKFKYSNAQVQIQMVKW